MLISPKQVIRFFPVFLKQPVTDELIATYSSLTACEVISNAEESLKVESCKLFTVSGTS